MTGHFYFSPQDHIIRRKEIVTKIQIKTQNVSSQVTIEHDYENLRT